MPRVQCTKAFGGFHGSFHPGISDLAGDPRQGYGPAGLSNLVARGVAGTRMMKGLAEHAGPWQGEGPALPGVVAGPHTPRGVPPNSLQRRTPAWPPVPRAGRRPALLPPPGKAWEGVLGHRGWRAVGPRRIDHRPAASPGRVYHATLSPVQRGRDSETLGFRSSAAPGNRPRAEGCSWAEAEFSRRRPGHRSRRLAPHSPSCGREAPR